MHHSSETQGEVSDEVDSRDDLEDWQKFSNGVNNVGGTREAMDFLELKTWTHAEFGAGVVDSKTATARFKVL